ncbi:MAG: hypothetical protein ACTSYC_02870 [Promethearchaeota archaeon]
MKQEKYRFILLVILLFNMGLFLTLNTPTIIDENSLKRGNIQSNNEKDDSIKTSSINYKKKGVSGELEKREGKIFTNFTTITSDCYINRYQTELSNQPELYLQNWNLTHAKMNFDNITALNYTYNLEYTPSEFFGSPYDDSPFYIFQKFWVELDQYINNVSIFIQDINNPNEGIFKFII